MTVQTGQGGQYQQVQIVTSQGQQSGTTAAAVTQAAQQALVIQQPGQTEQQNQLIYQQDGSAQIVAGNLQLFGKNISSCEADKIIV